MTQDLLKNLSFFTFALLNGMRHGLDVDHLAAISDIAAAKQNPRLIIFYTILYALGHGLMVIILGLMLLLLGQSLPENLGKIFEKVIGVSLILLGFYVIYSLLRNRRNFKIKSRGVLMAQITGTIYHKLLHFLNLSHNHPKFKQKELGPKTVLGIGLLHGIGAETPTQLAALLVFLGIGNKVSGLIFLLIFTLGIFISNVLIGLFSVRLYPLVGWLAAIFSFVVGVMFLR